MSKAYRINVENLVYAEVLTDDLKETTYGEVKQLSEAMQVQLTPSVATGQLYGDGSKVATDSKLTGVTSVFDVTKIELPVLADILGAKYKNGMLVTSGSDQAKEIAVGYKVMLNKAGKAQYIWFLKGKAQPFGNTVQQATESINYSTDSLTIDFVPRRFDGAIKVEMDSSLEDFVEGSEKTWFDKPPTLVETSGE